MIATWRNVDPQRPTMKRTDGCSPEAYAVALTEQRMYVVTCKYSMRMKPKSVKAYWVRHYSNFLNWHFSKIKSNKGKLTEYSFMFVGDDGMPNDTLYAFPAEAEPFIEIFEARMAEFLAVENSADVAGQLAALHALWTDGVLSDDEYQRSKELFLGKNQDERAKTETSLRNLKQLLDSGVLSESEFRTKKWQILNFL